MLRSLDLFSGIAGISVALRDYCKTVAYCELDPYCQAVLLSRMASGDIENAPIWDDVTTLDGNQFKGKCDIIIGGFPCQDISVAGHGAGLEGKRSGLFFEIVRLAKEIKPKFIFLENVPAITKRGGVAVITALAEVGYDCRWCCISASSVGALHKRERWFLLAYSKHDGASSSENRRGIGEEFIQRKQHEQEESVWETERASGISGDVATTDFKNYCDTNSKPSRKTDSESESKSSCRKTWGRSTRQYWPFESRDDWQETIGRMGKCIDGISAKLDYNTQRLRALGNAVVPCQAKEAFEILMGLKT